MNSIKSKVSLYGIKPEMAPIHSVVVSVFAEHGIDCVVTSAVRQSDGISLHGAGFAKDYRANSIAMQEDRDTLLTDLKKSLPMCDIILHGKSANIHYHVEFDPKDDQYFQADKAFYKLHKKWPHR